MKVHEYGAGGLRCQAPCLQRETEETMKVIFLIIPLASCAVSDEPVKVNPNFGQPLFVKSAPKEIPNDVISRLDSREIEGVPRCCMAIGNRVFYRSPEGRL